MSTHLPEQSWPLCFAFLLGMGVLLGQDVEASDVFGVPVSNEVIRGKLTLPFAPSKPIEFSIREGALLAVDVEDKFGYGFVARLVEDPSEVRYSWRPVRIDLRDMTSVVLTASPVRGSEPFAFSDPDWSSFTCRLEIEGVSKAYFRLPPPPAQASDAEVTQQFGRGGGGICCVACNGIKVCATSVSTDCGSCNTRDYFLELSSGQ